MAVVNRATGAPIVMGGAPGLSGRDGEDGQNGKDGLNGANGKDGLPGAGTLVTLTAAVAIPMRSSGTVVVNTGNGTCTPADPTNPAHRGKVVGHVTGAVSSGSAAIIKTVGLISNVAGAWTDTAALYVGTGGALVARADVPANAAWLQQVATAVPGGVNFQHGLVGRLSNGGATLVSGAGGFALPATADDLATGTAGRWPDTALIKSALRTDPTDTNAARSIVTAPYLAGLRNKTINVKRYASVAGAVADLQDGFTFDVPAGYYTLRPDGAATSIANKSFAVQGEGRGVSVLLATAAGQKGLVLNQDSYFRRMSVKNLSILSTVPSADVALQILRPIGISSIESGITIEDLEVNGDDPSVNGFGVGIDLYYAWNTHIDRYAFRGRNGELTAAAIQMRGQSTPVTTRSCDVTWTKYGHYAPLGTKNEGPIGDCNQFVAVETGYFFGDGLGYAHDGVQGFKQVRRRSDQASVGRILGYGESTAASVRTICAKARSCIYILSV